ncbi:MAG: copper amine oxidase N-terminal domain-containing protein [Oscillospiraceae bacterium]|nr:copper amine oxidase N-terminal domain-containing protein [Oscillospiraceae bacterium]
MADFIQTPKQSVSDENYIFTLEQYLVTDNAALVIYSIEAKTEAAAAELNAVDESGYSTFFDMDTISFVPTDFEKVRFGGFCDGSLADGKYDTETKKYYMVDCVDFSNPEDIDFTLSLNKINGAPKITVPMAKNIETETAVLGDVTIKYSPISLEVIAPYVTSPIIDDFCGTFGYYIYFKMNDGSIKTVSQLYELSAMGVENDAVGNELPSTIYLSKEVIEPESFKSVIVYNVEYDANDSEEPFGVSENALSCLEYQLGDTENPKEFNLPDYLKPFVMKPYIKDFLRIPLRELCEHIGADIKWDNDTQSAIVKYRGSEYIIPNNSCVFTKDGETIDMYNDLTDRATFIDENGRMIINGKITDAMDISTHMIGCTNEDTDYDVRKFLMHILP